MDQVKFVKVALKKLDVVWSVKTKHINMELFNSCVRKILVCQFCLSRLQKFIFLKGYHPLISVRPHSVKSVCIRSFSGPHFPAFRLNTKRYSASLRIQSECGKIRTRKTPNMDTFHATSFLNTVSNVTSTDRREN